MSLAKRLEEAAREGRITEAQADSILEQRKSLWLRKERSGQMLLVYLTAEMNQPIGSAKGE
jgi:hypothetical protein